MLIKQIFASFLVLASAGQAVSLDFDQTPYVSGRAKAAIQRHYDSGGCKDSYTLAVSQTGFWSVQCYATWDPEGLRRGALQKCEHNSGTPCQTVVEAGVWVQNPQVEPRMDYEAIRQFGDVPFIREAAARRIIDLFTLAEGHKAVALARNGAWAYAAGKESAEDAIKAALGSCERNDGYRARCLIFAVDEVVLFDQETDIYPER